MDNILLHIVYRGMPPTSNKIYIRGTILSSVARKFAEDFSKYVAQNHLHQLTEIDSQAVYAIHLRFYFDTLTNASWNNMGFPPSKRAKSRYKRIDLDNRIKLLTDCVRDAIGVDDCQFFAGTQEKHQDSTDPRIEIFVQKVNAKDFGIGADFYKSLPSGLQNAKPNDATGRDGRGTQGPGTGDGGVR